MSNHIIKLQVKARKQQDREFKRLYKKAVSTIRRLKETKPTKQALINDLLECNNIEIIHFLGHIKPKTKAEYIQAINKLLEFESASHEYDAKMVYKVGAEGKRELIEGLKCYSGGFGAITEHIRKHHRYIDLKNKITNISEG
jgi:hypothetical protein